MPIPAKSPDRTSASIVPILTPAEWRIAVLLADGWNYEQIAEELYASPRTIETHRTNVARKLGEHYNMAKITNRDIRYYVLAATHTLSTEFPVGT
jgi:DNA-binding NarL/FixJ family response regulator